MADNKKTGPFDDPSEGGELNDDLDTWGDLFDDAHEAEALAPEEPVAPESEPEPPLAELDAPVSGGLDAKLAQVPDDTLGVPDDVTTGVFDTELPTPGPNNVQYEAELEVVDELLPHDPVPDPDDLVDPDLEVEIEAGAPDDATDEPPIDDMFADMEISSGPVDDDDMPEIEIQAAPAEIVADNDSEARRFTSNIIRRVPEPAPEANIDDDVFEKLAIESLDVPEQEQSAESAQPEILTEPAPEPQPFVPMEISVAKDEPVPEVEIRRVALGLAASGFALPDAVEPDAGEDQEAAWRLSLLESELVARAENGEAGTVARCTLQAAYSAQAAGESDKSLQHAQAACEKNTEYLPAHRMLRRLFIERGQVDDALQALAKETALSSDKERPGLLRLRADYLLLAGHSDEARAAFEEVLTLRPDDPRSQLALIEHTYANDTSADRVANLSKQLENATGITYDSGFSRALATLRGRLLELAGEDDHARTVYQQVREAWPEDKATLFPLLRLATSGDSQAAATRTAELFPHASPGLSLAVGRWQAMAHGDDADFGVSLLQPVFGSEDATADPVFLATTCELFVRSERHDVAASTALAWANTEVVPARVAQAFRTAAGIQSGPLQRPAEAATSLRRALDADPGDTAAARELELAYIAAENWDAAIELNRATANFSSQGAAYERARAGFLLAQTERLDEGLLELEKASEVLESSQDPAALMLGETLAGLYASTGRTVDAAQGYRRGAESATQWREPAFARLRAARTVESIVPDTEVATGPTEAGAIYSSALGEAAGSLVTRAAIRALARIAEIGQDGPGLFAQLEAAQNASDDPDRVAEFALQRAHMALGGQDEEGAEKILVAALSTRPQESRMVQLLVSICAGTDRFDDVARVLSDRADALDDSEQAAALRYRAAAANLVSGKNIPRAIEQLEKVVKDQPMFDGANALLESAVRRAADHRDAGSSRQAPRDTTTLIRTAEALTGRGQPAQAVELFRKAAQERAQDPILRDGFERAATLAKDHAILAELALSDLKAAEKTNDTHAKCTAYELLARVDTDLRDDATSATLAWRSVISLTPRHGLALRALEKQYLEENRREDLISAYQQIEATLTDSSEVVAVALARAQLCQQIEKPRDALKAYQHAYRASPQCRLALFHLEAKARHGSAGVASLADAIAVYFAGDERAQAAFLTRAGEAFANAGQLDESIDRFRRAAQIVVGYVPALRAWRDVALRERRWEDVIEAAEAEASATADANTESDLHLLAASVAMDHLNDSAQAIELLQHALAIDGKSTEAFGRLRSLLETSEEDEALARMMEQRIDATKEQGTLPALHLELAQLCQDRLHDAERAKKHLQVVLQLRPNHRDALLMLSDIEAVAGRWPEASQTLVTLAKIENDPERSKNIFFRLGQIYTDHLPNADWAMQSFRRVLAVDPNHENALDYLSQLATSQGDHQTALKAANRLVTTAKDNDARMRYLHRIANIYEDGMQDIKRAEAATRKAMEVNVGNEEAVDAMSKFYQRTKDIPSLRVHLNRVCGQMRTRLVSNLFDGAAYRVLSRTLMARAEAGVMGAEYAARNAAEFAVFLEAGSDAEQTMAQQAQSGAPNVAGLGELSVDEHLFHPSIPNALRPMFRILQGTLAKRFPPDLRSYGVGRGDRLPKTHPMRIESDQLATILGVQAHEIYVSTTRPSVLALEESKPLSIIVGEKLLDMSVAPQLRFALGRVFKLSRSYLSVAARLSHEELTLFLSAVLRQFNPAFSCAGIDDAKLGTEHNKVARLIARRTREELFPFATEIAGASFDPGGIWSSVQNTGNRAGLLCSGSLTASLQVVARLAGKADVRAAADDPHVAELAQFAVSDRHSDLRKILRQT